MDLNFLVFAMGVHIFRASNDVGPLFLGPGSTLILEINTKSFGVNFKHISGKKLGQTHLWTNEPSD
jgi:hypothetical protein